MSTYLELSNDLARESGLSGAAASISAVTGQSGQALRVVEWVAQSYKSIQNRHPNWRWLRRTFTGTTTTGQSEYAYTAFTDTTDSAAISRFSRWLPYDDSGYPLFTIYVTASGVAAQQRMIFLPWDYFLSIYRFGTQTSAAPAHYSVTPANKIALGPAPDATGYTVGGDYQRSAQTLAADSDVPEMPEDFHDLIVFRALERYARFSAAPEALAQAEREGGRLLRALEVNQLPAISFGGPLA